MVLRGIENVAFIDHAVKSLKGIRCWIYNVICSLVRVGSKIQIVNTVNFSGTAVLYSFYPVILEGTFWNHEECHSLWETLTL